jgi:hypothetical protein
VAAASSGVNDVVWVSYRFPHGAVTHTCKSCNVTCPGTVARSPGLLLSFSLQMNREEAKRLGEKFTAEALEKLLSEIYGKWQHERRHSCPYSSVDDLRSSRDTSPFETARRATVSECVHPADVFVEQATRVASFLSRTPRMSRLQRRGNFHSVFTEILFNSKISTARDSRS